MTYHGTVQDGTVVLHDGATLPNGTLVTVVPVMRTAEGRAGGDTRTIWQKLAELGRQVESEPCDLPSDLAANHDYYLHGLPKRQ